MTGSQLQVTTTNLPKEIVLVEVKGELDLASSSKLNEAVTRLREEGKSRLIFGLNDLMFIDSTGIKTLTDANRSMKDLGGEVGIVCAKPYFKRIFGMVGFSQLFAMWESVEEACAAFPPAKKTAAG